MSSKFFLFLIFPIVLGQMKTPNIQRNLEETNNNFITVYIMRNTWLDVTLYTKYEEISHITYENQNYDNGKIPAYAGKPIQIHFSKAVESLHCFFFCKECSLDDDECYWSFFPLIYEVDFSNFDSSNLKSTSLLFYWLQSLQSINFNNFNTSQVTTMEGMFAFCFQISSLNLSDFRTPLVTDMSGMFYLCQNLEFLDIISLIEEQS